MDVRLGLSVVAVVALLSAGAAAEGLRLIDAHSQFDQDVEPQRIIRLMDAAGVAHTILSARGRVRPEELVAFARRHAGRITAAVRTKGNPYVEGSGKYYRLLERQAAMPGFAAMAEVILWHARKGGKAPQWIVPVDSKQVQAALEAAIGNAWPFVAHIEFAAAGRDRDPFMAAFEAMLRGHPGHPFLLIHMGQLGAGEVRRLIETHPNVHFITSHANPVSIAKSKQPWVDLFAGENLAPAWRRLFVGHPDRFVLGFDNVFAEHWGEFYLEQVALWRKALAGLPPPVARAVAHGNAERLWRLAR